MLPRDRTEQETRGQYAARESSRTDTYSSQYREEKCLALIKEFIARPKNLRRQPTRVACHYAVERVGGSALLIQFDTAGSEQRDMPGKVSQTLQLDEGSARELWEILSREFGFR